MIGIAYGSAPTIPGVYVLTLVILVFLLKSMENTHDWNYDKPYEWGLKL